MLLIARYRHLAMGLKALAACPSKSLPRHGRPPMNTKTALGVTLPLSCSSSVNLGAKGCVWICLHGNNWQVIFDRAEAHHPVIVRSRKS